MSPRDRLRANDRRFLGVAATLSDEDWAAPSLCDQWNNHEVLAHLVIGYSGALTSLAAELVRHAGAFDPANADLARSLAAHKSPAELLDDFARLIDRPTGTGRYFPRRLLLGDHITHELDMLYALDRSPAIPSDPLIAVLNIQVALPNPFVPAYRNSRGLRLIATDADWTHGERGPEVSGRAAELVSVLGNRPRIVARLEGDGVAELTARVLSRQTRTGAGS
ncbi:MAG TPA: maleylpyruvate isomerase family mycothiol-dependent enzyme [Mycobacterium sp.]|nr:maleylpyruvate isomerase family mycothiol-dependent enzyme [Mycobacterium sp.]